MADTTRDPPPLFDDEPTTKEDDGDDLFSSAVQGVVSFEEPYSDEAVLGIPGTAAPALVSDTTPSLAATSFLMASTEQDLLGGPPSLLGTLPVNTQISDPVEIFDTLLATSTADEDIVTPVVTDQETTNNDSVSSSASLLHEAVDFHHVVEDLSNATDEEYIADQKAIENFADITHESYVPAPHVLPLGGSDEPTMESEIVSVADEQLSESSETPLASSIPVELTLELPTASTRNGTQVELIQAMATNIQSKVSAVNPSILEQSLEAPTVSAVILQQPTSEISASLLVEITPELPVVSHIDVQSSVIETIQKLPIPEAVPPSPAKLPQGSQLLSATEEHPPITDPKVELTEKLQHVSTNDVQPSGDFSAPISVELDHDLPVSTAGTVPQPDFVSPAATQGQQTTHESKVYPALEMSGSTLQQILVSKKLSDEDLVSFGKDEDDTALAKDLGHPMFAKMKCLKKPEKSTLSSHFLSEDETSEIPLEVSLDDDDDGLFSGGAFDKSQLKTSPLSATAAVLPPMGAPLTPPATVMSPAAPAGAGPEPTAVTTTNNITTPPLPTATMGLPAAGFYSPAQPSAAATSASLNMPQVSAGVGGASNKEYIEIMISEPQKVGDGMNSYMAYKMTISTNIAFFKKQSWSVTRRFSDYLGLHAKLVEKHLHAGRIIPPAPEKDALNATKLRLSSSSDGVEGAAEFLERRRAALQRYMQRTAALPHLRSDPDFREFIELEAELPRATQTSAMSGAGVMRLFNRVGETVNKMTFKMEESDSWFEERVHQVESLETELRRLHAALESLAGGRRELAMSSINLSKAAAVLSSVEEHSALNRALHQLSEATDRTHTVYHAQADADFYILCETTRDYINLIGAVKEVFHERVKVFQAWQYSQTMLAKKRDHKAKTELTARQEKIMQAQQEVEEWEGKVERNQEHFERISTAIKKELEQFDAVRVQDFKNMFIRYLESMVTSQQQVIRVWESFLPEAKAIS